MYIFIKVLGFQPIKIVLINMFDWRRALVAAFVHKIQQDKTKRAHEASRSLRCRFVLINLLDGLILPRLQGQFLFLSN